MKGFIVLATVIFMSSFASAKTGRAEWGACKKELDKYCTSAVDDMEKHECLEEAPKGKVAKACLDQNKKNGAALGHSHASKGAEKQAKPHSHGKDDQHGGHSHKDGDDHDHKH